MPFQTYTIFKLLAHFEGFRTGINKKSLVTAAASGVLEKNRKCATITTSRQRTLAKSDYGAHNSRK